MTKKRKMKKILIATLTAALLGTAVSCSNHNDSKDNAEKTNDDNLAGQAEKDADRIVDLYAGNLYEIASSELAVNKASVSEVKKLAEKMLTAHTKMKSDIESTAASRNITLPTSLADNQSKDIENLNSKTGIDFDNDYVKQMQDEHEKAIRILDRISDKSDDASLKEWAMTNKPELQNHLDMVISTKNMVKDVKKDMHETNSHEKNTDRTH